MTKSRDAFRTISEVSDWLDTPAHVLRFWESKFPQIKPVKRAGGRRYYRPDDMELLSGIKTLLHDQGMTIKGVQKVLRDQGVRHVMAMGPALIDTDDPLVNSFAVREIETATLFENAEANRPASGQIDAWPQDMLQTPPVTVVPRRPQAVPDAALTGVLADVPDDPSDEAYNPRSRFHAAFAAADPAKLARAAGRLGPLVGRLVLVRDRLGQR